MCIRDIVDRQLDILLWSRLVDKTFFDSLFVCWLAYLLKLQTVLHHTAYEQAESLISWTMDHDRPLKILIFLQLTTKSNLQKQIQKLKSIYKSVVCDQLEVWHYSNFWKTTVPMKSLLPHELVCSVPRIIEWIYFNQNIGLIPIFTIRTDHWCMIDWVRLSICGNCKLILENFTYLHVFFRKHALFGTQQKLSSKTCHIVSLR